MTLHPFDLNLRHLRALIAVHAHGSVAAAAPAVSLSQPALTQAIAKLEKQLGSTLFERHPDGMRATEAGTLAHERVAAALAQLSSGLPAGGGSVGAEHRLTMTQLRAFLALVRGGSFAVAGRETGHSQTAVHRAVRELEDAIGRPLVERRGRGVVLNAAGQRFARAARLALGEIAALVAELGASQEGTSIAVGTLPLARPYVVPEAMARMVAEPAPVGFRIFEGSWVELVEQLRDGLIDLVVGELPPDELPDLTQTPLHQDRLLVVGGVQHPLAGPRARSLSRLGAFPWIVGPAGSPLRQAWEQLFAGRPLPASPIECGSVMIIGRLLTSANFLTVLAPDQVALQVRSGLLARVGPPLAHSDFRLGLLTRSGWRPTTAQRRFIDLLREVAVGVGGPRSVVGPWV